MKQMGDAALVDASAIVAAFSGFDRIADSTGIPLEDAKADTSADFRADLGINAFAQNRGEIADPRDRDSLTIIYARTVKRRCRRPMRSARAIPKVTAVAATTMPITRAAVITRCAMAILRFVNGRALRTGWWNPIPAIRSLCHGFARLQTARISVWWHYRTGCGLRPGRKAAQAAMRCGDLATKG